MDDRGFQTILRKASSIDSLDWKRLRAYSLVVLALCTGMRNKELRLCQVCDLHIDEMKVQAEHVKGEGTYGQAREILVKYLRARSKLVAEMSPGNLALFPALRGKGDGYLSSNGLENMKRLVETETGTSST